MPRACFKQFQLNTNNEVDGALYGCGSVLVISPALDLGIRHSYAILRVVLILKYNSANDLSSSFLHSSLYKVFAFSKFCLTSTKGVLDLFFRV